MHPDTLGTEAIRAFFTVQCCWLNNEEIYLEKGGRVKLEVRHKPPN